MIIVGLGNPGKQYEKTRHNCGFMFLDSVAHANNVEFKLNKTLEAMIAEIYIDNKKHILVKPITYMNNSGNAVYKVMNYYKKSESIDVDDLIVIYDDMDLQVGDLRIRKNGSSGGHNGMKSIIACVGTTNFKRIRMGIGHPLEGQIEFVLGKFSKTDSINIENILQKAPNIIDDLIKRGIDYIMNNYN